MGLSRLRKRAHGKHLVRSHRLDVGDPNCDNCDGLAQGIEDLQKCAVFTLLGMPYIVDQDSNVALPQSVLAEVAGKGHSLVERNFHRGFSLRGFNVTNRTWPSKCWRIQMAVTASRRPFGPTNSPSVRRISP